MRPLVHPKRGELSLVGLLYALGDPLRLEIVERISARDGLTCGETVRGSVPKATLSRQLKVLRDHGVIQAQQRGRQYYNSLRREDIDARFPGLLDAVLAGTRKTATRAKVRRRANR